MIARFQFSLVSLQENKSFYYYLVKLMPKFYCFQIAESINVVCYLEFLQHASKEKEKRKEEEKGQEERERQRATDDDGRSYFGLSVSTTRNFYVYLRSTIKCSGHELEWLFCGQK